MRQHNVSVENGARRIGDRILVVVALREDGVEGSDGAAAFDAVASALDELRQLGKHRGRVTLGGGCLTDGQADFALRLCKARQRIH
jgi:hypothetical protein